MNLRFFLAAATAILLFASANAQTRFSDTSTSVRAGYATTVAMSNGLVFAGEPSNTVTPGLVYVYSRNGEGTWKERARLSAAGGTVGNGFGRVLAVEGSTMVVSAIRSNGADGTVFVFEQGSDGNWVQTELLMAPAGSDDQVYGAALALSGRALLVGAPGEESDRGVVYMYARNASGKWELEESLRASDGEENDLFGLSLAVTENSIIVGAPGRRDRRGSVYVYTNTDGTWGERMSFSAFGLEPGSRFGSSMAAEGSRLLIGAPRHERSSGAVYNYSFEENEWVQTGALVPFDASPNVRFGTTVNFVAGAVWVGAPGADSFEGAIYMIEQDGSGDWKSATKLTPEDGLRRTRFGEAVAAESDVAVIGRPGADGGSGSALIYEHRDGNWIQATSFVGAVEGLDSIVGETAECVDGKIDDYDCESVELVSFLSIRDLGGGRHVDLNDLWGWTDPVTGKEWALVGRTDGTSFVDISDPSNPVYAGQLKLTEGARTSDWRDIKVYKDHAYIVADGAGNHGMQVFDLTRLRSTENPPVTFSSDADYSGFASAHNIVINEDTGFAYAVGVTGGGQTCGGGLHMINIQNPIEPVFAGCFADTGTGLSRTGYSHDALCIVYHGPDAEHRGREICFGSNETALSIADVTDKDHPIALSKASYPNVSYAHQGWITDDHRYFYLNDELDEFQGRVRSTRTLIWDVSDLDDPQLASEYQAAQKASDHNLYVRGSYLYQSNYTAGLRILDISDPVNPFEVAFFDTTPGDENAPGFSGSWSNYPYFSSGNIVVTSISEGIFVVRRRDIDL